MNMMNCLLSGHYVMHRQVSMYFLLLLLYLITVACILEISLGLCWHKDECMGQRSTINHNKQLFISLNNHYAITMIIQWPSVEMYMGNFKKMAFLHFSQFDQNKEVSRATNYPER